MSREGHVSRARAQARLVEEAIAEGAGFYLLGCPIVVLYHEATRPAGEWLAARADDAPQVAANDPAPR